MNFRVGTPGLYMSFYSAVRRGQDCFDHSYCLWLYRTVEQMWTVLNGNIDII